MTVSDIAVARKMRVKLVADNAAFPRVLVAADVLVAHWAKVDTIDTDLIMRAVTEAVRQAVHFKDKPGEGGAQ